MYSSNVIASVVVPTYARPYYLRDALDSLLNQDFPAQHHEIIVVDNKPNREVQKIIKELCSRIGRMIHYIEEPSSGLHNARHTGAKKAFGGILLFIDDDIIADKGWLSAIVRRFQDPQIAVVGGKILPRWEGVVPEWLKVFRRETEYGWTIGHLSLLDFGDNFMEIPAKYVWGANFSIRKSLLYECGGFHPDAMPQKLIKFRGDGETGLTSTLEAKGYKAFYEPKALIYHRIPSERLTIEYFCQRAFNQGISNSYTEIRKNKGIVKAMPVNISLRVGIRILKSLKARSIFSGKNKMSAIISQVTKAYERGKAFHLEEVAQNPELLRYVLKEHYF